MMERSAEIQKTLENLPHLPGVYQYFNEEKKIIYVGKAKDLKKRVTSYFAKEHHDNAKLRILVRNIHEIRFIVVASESDALLLENNLIKEYQPRYNILLKDDKSFPWIAVKRETFPRVVYTRQLIKDGSEYFGPFTSTVMVKTLLSLIKQLFPLRTCKLDLSLDKIDRKMYKPCLEFHIGNCLGPCIAKQSLDDYMENIQTIRDILKGNLNQVSQHLRQMMEAFAKELDFENANLIKEKMAILDNYRSKSTIVNPSIHNIDVFSLASSDKMVVVNYLRVLNGAIVQVHSMFTSLKLDEDLSEILSMAILEMREKLSSNAREIVVSQMPDVQMQGITYTIPKTGDKLKLLELSMRNSKMFLQEKLKQSSEMAEKKGAKANIIVQQMKDVLCLEKLPLHMECFDNSNLQGTNPVASCVVFKNGKPSVKDYRHFNIKTVIGIDDFASMKEIVYRRYKRLLDENEPLPNLIVIDGGKGQLGAALDSLEKLNLIGKIEIISIAKRLEEIFKPGDNIPLYVDKKSPVLKVIQHIRNEAHRFGITFHRNKRSNTWMNSEFENIKGIGEKTVNELFIKFKSAEAIHQASLEELAEVIGMAKAKILREHLGKE